MPTQFDYDCDIKTPVNGDAVFLFKLLDSDKPHKEPDLIGIARVSLADIIFNQRLDSDENYQIDGQKYPKHYLRARVSFKPNPE